MSTGPSMTCRISILEEESSSDEVLLEEVEEEVEAVIEAKEVEEEVIEAKEEEEEVGNRTVQERMREVSAAAVAAMIANSLCRINQRSNCVYSCVLHALSADFIGLFINWFI